MNHLPALPIWVSRHACDRFYERCPVSMTLLRYAERVKLIKQAVRAAPVIRQDPEQAWLAGLGELDGLVFAVKVEPQQIVVKTVLTTDQVQTSLEQRATPLKQRRRRTG